MYYVDKDQKQQTMSSLLKYRFQKKDTDKLSSDKENDEHEACTSQEDKDHQQASTSQDTIVQTSELSQDTVLSSTGSFNHTVQSSNGSMDTVQSSNGSSLETQEESSQSTTQNSTTDYSSVSAPPQNIPKTGVSAKRGALVLGSDSETDSPVKNASPWLSKQSAINSLTNGHSTPAATNPSQDQTQEFKDEQRELYSNMAILQDIYPNTPRPKIVEALAGSDNNVDMAIDWIISHQTEGSTRKRQFTRIQADSSDEDSLLLQPPQKKARPLDYSESQEDSADLDFEGKVRFLGEAFPNATKELLILTLKSKDHSLEKASDALSTSGLYPTSRTRPVMNKYKSLEAPSSPKGPPKLQPMVSPTENVGSIKAYQAARLARQASGGGGDSPTVGGKSKSKQSGKDRNIFALYSNNSAGQVDDDEDDSGGGEYSGGSDSEDEETPSDPIINFLNEATADELVAMDGCSKKKAEVLEKIRPFNGWTDMLEKLSDRGRELGFNVISSCKAVLHMRSVVHKLMMKCQKIATNMEYIVSELTGITSLEESERTGRYLTQQPSILSEGVKLKPYQIVGVNWLYLMHRQGLDGILGDEMGLGKTIQTIAFLAQLLQDGKKGPHVIIVPSSTIDNWLRELHVWCPTLKVSLYYGSQEDRKIVRQQLLDDREEFNVIVTTYNMASGSVEDRTLFKKFQFHYSIFDEGHMLKNMTSMRYQSLMKIKASRRLLLTGTPLQNNLVELMSLLAFVMPDMFCGKTDHIKKIFTTISSRSNYETKGEYERQTISQAKSILKPFFLRRLKREVLQQLPSKSDIIEKVSMAFDQGDLYDNLRNEFNRNLLAQKDGTTSTLKSSGSAMLMQLRKAANHHLLHRKLYNEEKLKTMAKLMVKEPTHREANVDYVFEDMQVMSDFELHKLCLQYKNVRKFALDEEQILDTGKFRYLDKLLPDLKQQGDRVLLFSQFTMMLDVIEDYMHARGYVFIRLDGQTPVSERQDLIDQFNSDTDIFIFLLSTKAGGLGINLTAANVVVLHDIDFNPYNDKQAEDRCHRVGQTRDVTVYRLVSKNTVEEAMLRCGQAKLQLEQDVTGQTEGKSD